MRVSELAKALEVALAVDPDAGLEIEEGEFELLVAGSFDTGELHETLTGLGWAGWFECGQQICWYHA